ncbi:hypothetical protein A1704_20165 [Chryseobacterium cucumeris]|uniref:reverse transcriptase/maturase family protein n=1 Tax=Chryseobacterium cucumeris TaxID=1813611 RepID=UPI000788B037|nr:reverse transcriptase/maturase family protein [Chryseobacterium cucumeris]KYH04080.1 hypothetical protein A1704_20165 [Chryseobacterium cucumeris]
MLEDYCNREEILFRLCKARAKLARHRGKSHLDHIISADQNYNYHYNNQKSNRHKGNDIDLLCSIMPSRRKWINPTIKERYPKNDGQRINSVDHNTRALIKTIYHYRKTNPTEPFLLRLENFIDEIIESINDKSFSLTSPQILSKLKKPNDKSCKICRPICVFPLKDKIIISIINKYLTKAFDNIFYDHSYAFRAKKDDAKFPPTHHSAIEHILEYKNKYKGKRLWVSECDISKFFDTVNHNIVREKFRDVIKIHNKTNKVKIDNRAILIFNKYLQCYDFQKFVYALNNDKNYWIEKKREGGTFEWVKDDLLKLNCYKNIRRNRIGIPQGGALSGLIANIVLHSIDMEMKADEDEKLCYVRFCDDMLLIHPNRKICNEKTKIYFNGLEKLKLISHPPKPVSEINKKIFWNDSKSKSPYKWSKLSTNSLDRIGFVGYEICYNGTLRVRKSSLTKEKRKIRDLTEHTLSILKNGKRKSDEMILESVSNKLIGMSVGRVTMKNYKFSDNEMCWVNGFTLLCDNHNLRTQLRRLDHYRSKHLSRFKKKLEKIPEAKPRPSDEARKIGKHFFIKIGGISYADSEAIRLELQNSKILNTKFILSKYRKELLIKSASLLILSSKYNSYSSQIYSLLTEKEKEDREVPYYGKPFSYFYHVIDKK